MPRGGARKNSGVKPGPHGKKIDRSVALSAGAWAFLASGGQTPGSAIEARVRASAAFKAWVKATTSGVTD